MRGSTGARLLWGQITVVMAAGVLIAAGCGGDDDDDGAAGATTAAATPARRRPPSSATTAGIERHDDRTERWVGHGDRLRRLRRRLGRGRCRASSRSRSATSARRAAPIEVGPTNDDGVEIGVKFINEQAGGIGGHPIELVKCYIASTEEEGQQCGQQMANDEDIVAVVEGPIAVGAESMFAALGDKPVVSGVSVNAVDTVQPSAAVLYGGAQYILAPYATFARDTLQGQVGGARLSRRAPALDIPAAGQASAFEAAGIPIKVVSYPANAADLTVPLLAADAQNADVVMPVINPNDCVKFEQAIQQLGIPDEKVLASPICLTPTTIEGLGDFPKWIYAIASAQTFDTTDPGVPPYQEILTDQGQEKLIGDPWVNVGFGQILTLAKWLNGAGADNLTPDAITEQMLAFEGPLALGSPVIKCGKYPEAPGVCNDHTQFYQWNGSRQPDDEGRRLGRPAGGMGRARTDHRTPRRPLTCRSRREQSSERDHPVRPARARDRRRHRRARASASSSPTAARASSTSPRARSRWSRRTRSGRCKSDFFHVTLGTAPAVIVTVAVAVARRRVDRARSSSDRCGRRRRWPSSSRRSASC